ncbi:MAG: hypothetical protein LBV51_00330 [Acholeplasmatales bacterium]|jgi:hypothetical protein|nr:hypothetical protein [Acholeplasmatales bacterium]
MKIKNMKEDLVKYLFDLDENIVYDSYEIAGDTLIVVCHMPKKEGFSVKKKETKVIKDVPFNNMNTILHLRVRYYYHKESSSEGTLMQREYLPFITQNTRRTKRYTDFIINYCEGMNSYEAERKLKNNNLTSITDNTITKIRKQIG